MKYDLSQLNAWKHAVKAGDTLLLSGTVYTARDAAHLRLTAMLEKGEPLPLPLQGAVIYYAGPAGTPPGKIIGSCGPTTSARMTPFVPRFLAEGMAAVIGKGEFNPTVRKAFSDAKALYFAAVGGAGARIAASVKSIEVIAFPELGCESVKKLTVCDLPVFVAYDLHGNDIYTHSDK